MPCPGGPPLTGDSNAGFAAADGLVALTLVSVLVALVLNATSTGLKATRAGAARRDAAAEAEYRLLTEWPRMAAPGERFGPSRAGGIWRVAASRTVDGDEAGGGLCRVSSSVVSGAPVRTYRLETVRFCAPVVMAP